MKKLRLFVAVGALALAFISPTESFAYKYYVHLKNGHSFVLNAENAETAEMAFKELCARMPGMEDAYLTKRPRGGFICCESVDDLR